MTIYETISKSIPTIHGTGLALTNIPLSITAVTLSAFALSASPIIYPAIGLAIPCALFAINAAIPAAFPESSYYVTMKNSYKTTTAYIGSIKGPMSAAVSIIGFAIPVYMEQSSKAVLAPFIAAFGLMIGGVFFWESCADAVRYQIPEFTEDVAIKCNDLTVIALQATTDLAEFVRNLGEIYNENFIE